MVNLGEYLIDPISKVPPAIYIGKLASPLLHASETLLGIDQFFSDAVDILDVALQPSKPNRNI